MSRGRCFLRSSNLSKMIAIPNTMEEARATASSVFGRQVHALYLMNGGLLIDDMALVQNNDDIYVPDAHEVFERGRWTVAVADANDSVLPSVLRRVSTGALGALDLSLVPQKEASSMSPHSSGAGGGPLASPTKGTSGLRGSGGRTEGVVEEEEDPLLSLSPTNSLLPVLTGSTSLLPLPLSAATASSTNAAEAAASSSSSTQGLVGPGSGGGGGGGGGAPGTAPSSTSTSSESYSSSSSAVFSGGGGSGGGSGSAVSPSSLGSSSLSYVRGEKYLALPHNDSNAMAVSLSALGPRSLSDWITLNVGGTIFQTSRATLCRDPNSMLGRLFGVHESAIQWASTVDEKGAYLFDREPKYFAVLLNYLRTGEFVHDEGVSLHGVLMEARFFQIEDLEHRVIAVINETAPLARHPYADSYVVLAAQRDGLKFIEGPVENVMIALNGGQLPPRKAPYSRESEVLSRVYGLNELGWLLKNFKLSEVLDALKKEGWELVTSSTMTDHIFIFKHAGNRR